MISVIAGKACRTRRPCRSRRGREIEAREVVAGERGDGDDERHLRAGDQQRVAEGVPDARELWRRDLADARALTGRSRAPQEDASCRGADRGRRAARRRRPRRARPRPTPAQAWRRLARQQRPPARSRGPPAARRAACARAPRCRRAGAAGEGDRDEPEIGHDDRQRAPRSGRRRAPPSWPGAARGRARPARPSRRRARVAGARRRAISVHLDPRPLQQRAHVEEAPASSATAMPMTTRPSASAAP